MCAEITVLGDSTNKLAEKMSTKNLRFEFNLARISENLFNLYLSYMTMKFIIYIT